MHFHDSVARVPPVTYMLQQMSATSHSQGFGMEAPVVKKPKLHRVAAMLNLAPMLVPDVSKMRMTGLVANVTAQLKRLNLCAHQRDSDIF